MSIIIKGMDVPEKCNKCPFVDNDRNILRTCIISEGDVTADDGDAFDFRPNWCPIEPDRKKGKWIVTNKFVGCCYAKCNQCNAMQVFYHDKPLTNFCPNCGAKMEGEV